MDDLTPEQKQFIINVAKKVKELEERIKVLEQNKGVARTAPLARIEELKEKYILDHNHYANKKI